MFPLDPIGIWLSTGEIVLCDHGLHRSWSRHNSPKGRANDFLHVLQTAPRPFSCFDPNHYFSHQTLFMKFNHGLKHYQELRDLCQQDAVSLSFRPAAFNSYLLACLPDYQ